MGSGLMLFYVYEHWRPDRDECFYVGKGKGRRANQMDFGRNPHHRHIQDKLARLGMCVEVRLVAEGLAEKDAFRIERERIAFWRSDGADLANKTDGGEGGSGYKHTPEAIAKVVAFHTGRKRPPETRAKLSAAAKARPPRPDAVEIMARANRGQKRPPFSAEHRARIGEKSKGRKMSPETRAKLLAANTGRSFVHTPETRAKLSAARIGKKLGPLSEAHRAAISAGNKGKPKSPEHKAKISAARLAMYAEDKK
jgi:hypothetical protein